IRLVDRNALQRHQTRDDRPRPRIGTACFCPYARGSCLLAERYVGCTKARLMSDRKPCVRCGRTIDGYARICPYCNWDQNAPVPANEPQQTVATDYRPPEETKLRKYVLGGVGGFVMVVVLFFIGSHVHGRNPPPVTNTEQAAAP